MVFFGSDHASSIQQDEELKPWATPRLRKSEIKVITNGSTGGEPEDESFGGEGGEGGEGGDEGGRGGRGGDRWPGRGGWGYGRFDW